MAARLAHHRGDGTAGGMKTLNDVIYDLEYISYACQRDSKPEISPERWAAIGFSNVPEKEARYQAELAIIKARVAAEFPL